MSLDKSLKSRGSLERHRNVLSRAERIDRLKEIGRWDEEESKAIGLPKVAHRKAAVGKKTKEVKKPEQEAGAEEAPTEEKK
jgi:small basic protein (TIGR04137 family)